MCSRERAGKESGQKEHTLALHRHKDQNAGSSPGTRDASLKTTKGLHARPSLLTDIASALSLGSSVAASGWSLDARTEGKAKATASIAEQKKSQDESSTTAVPTPCVTKAESAERTSSSAYSAYTADAWWWWWWWWW